MLTVRLPDETDNSLTAILEQTGSPKTNYSKISNSS